LAHDPSHPLAPYIHHNLQNPFHKYSNNSNNNQEQPQPQPQPHKIDQSDQSFTITFLGTGAGGRANIKRSPTSTALKLNGYNILFDAGEGTQRQLAMTKNIGVKDIGKIFVTHLHADHVSGLLGVILQKEMGVVRNTRNISNNTNKQQGEEESQVLEIYGPVGIFNFIAMNVALTCSKIRNMELIIHELVRKSDQRSTPTKNVQKRTYPELARLGITRKSIQQGDDGVWTIQSGVKMKVDDVQGRNAHLRISIKAAEVQHVPNVQTLGYVLEETPLPAKIDVEKAKMLGIAPGPKYRALKNGFKVMSDDGEREVLAQDVIEEGQKKARKLAVLGDASRVPQTMRRLCRNADFLIYEATLEEGSEHVSRQRGHSTARMAGKFALEVNAKILAMNHISGRHDGQDSINSMVKSAEEGNKGKSDIVVAHDFMMVHIPYPR